MALMVFINVINPRSAIRRGINEYLPTLLKQGASVGANAMIVCSHTVGQYAFVEAGSVMTKDIPDYALVYGNPARIAGWICRCGEKLDFKGEDGTAKCHKCKEEYEKQGGVVRKSI